MENSDRPGAGPLPSGALMELDQVSVDRGGRKLLDGISLQFLPGEAWGISGPSGSGKTLLGQVISGHCAHRGGIRSADPAIVLVEPKLRFRDGSNRQDFYYQQRFNSTDADNSPTVRQELENWSGENAPGMKWAPGTGLGSLLALFQIEKILDEPLIQLSHGENKRVQLVRALLTDPDLLILDEPFTGLDPAGRSLLSSVLGQLSAAGLTILWLSTSWDLPEWVRHLAVLDRGSLQFAGLRKAYRPDAPTQHANAPGLFSGSLPESARSTEFSWAVRMVNVGIQYDGSRILQGINWELRRGERCFISGPNGAGKSTLLSLITGDNPQAYANEIYLFDRRRGTGESIWDIKRRIGYLSPEMQWYFDPGATCFQTLASGFFDTIGLFRPLTPEQGAQCMLWLDRTGLSRETDQLFSAQPAGAQRLLLLARALIKGPELLVLDEPCQGLDYERRDQVLRWIESYCQSRSASLVYVSHSLEDIPSGVDWFLRLEAGRIVRRERLNGTDQAPSDLFI